MDTFNEIQSGREIIYLFNISQFITTLLLQIKRLCKKFYFPFLFANKNDK